MLDVAQSIWKLCVRQTRKQGIYSTSDVKPSRSRIALGPLRQPVYSRALSSRGLHPRNAERDSPSRLDLFTTDLTGSRLPGTSRSILLPSVTSTRVQDPAAWPISFRRANALLDPIPLPKPSKSGQPPPKKPYLHRQALQVPATRKPTPK